MAEQMRSYHARGGPIGARMGDLMRLYRGTRAASAEMGAHVGQILERVRAAESQVRDAFGVEMTGLEMLEVGCGQLPRQLAYFGLRNRVVGIDLDVIPRGINPLTYLRVARRNGVKRAVKTVARKMMGFDRAFLRELAKQTGERRVAWPAMRAMDATKMEFADASMDVCYSFDVFEHLPDPAGVLAEARRVLRPGGVCYQSLHLFAAEDGFHDLRIIGGQREGVPYWAHLRPSCKDAVRASSYLNGWRLSAWREMLERELPGCRIMNTQRTEPRLTQELRAIRAGGELAEFPDEELLSYRLVVMWRKPAV